MTWILVCICACKWIKNIGLGNVSCEIQMYEKVSAHIFHA